MTSHSVSMWESNPGLDKRKLYQQGYTTCIVTGIHFRVTLLTSKFIDTDRRECSTMAQQKHYR